jgi:FhaA, N-terminal domain/FHA domain
MSFLRRIEQSVERLIEGLFGRAFRTNVQPVELARKLAKEMDDHRTVSVSRVYVPNEYTVYLAPDDRSQFSSYEQSLIDELQDHLAEHARRERYALLTPPQVGLETDEDLAVGEFGIATRMAQPKPAERPVAPASSGAGATAVYKQSAVPTQAASAEELGLEEEPEPASLELNGERRELEKRRVVIGRSKDCDIKIEDPNVSRRHAEVRREGPAYWLIDLGSTNGTDVNGRRAQRTKLKDGDQILIGTTALTFREAS